MKELKEKISDILINYYNSVYDDAVLRILEEVEKYYCSYSITKKYNQDNIENEIACLNTRLSEIDEEKLINGFIKIYDSGNQFNASHLIKILEDLIKDCKADQEAEPPKINIFYDDLKNTLIKHNILINKDNPTNVLETLNDLFNRFYEETRREYIEAIRDLQKTLKESNEKYRNENRLLNKDITLLAVENEKLKTKIKMNKILMENE